MPLTGHSTSLTHKISPHVVLFGHGGLGPQQILTPATSLGISITLFWVSRIKPSYSHFCLLTLGISWLPKAWTEDVSYCITQLLGTKPKPQQPGLESHPAALQHLSLSALEGQPLLGWDSAICKLMFHYKNKLQRKMFICWNTRGISSCALFGISPARQWVSVELFFYSYILHCNPHYSSLVHRIMCQQS
jgi:hypothetical protein